MTPTTTEPLQMFPELAGTRRFTSDEYHQLIAADILGPDDKVEMLDGYVVYKVDHMDVPPAEKPFEGWELLRRWSSDDYHRMIELGIIGEDEKWDRHSGVRLVAEGRS